MADVSLENVTKRFGKTTAVRDLSLGIYDGEFVVLLRPTGAGKTTTLRLVAGLETPEEGRITIDGADVTAAPPPPATSPSYFSSTRSTRTTPCSRTSPSRSRRPGATGRPSRSAPACTRSPRSCASIASSRTARPAFRAARCSGWRSAARWYAGPRSSSWTSRSPRSTPSCARSCGSSSNASSLISAPPSSTSPTTRSRRSRSRIASACSRRARWCRSARPGTFTSGPPIPMSPSDWVRRRSTCCHPVGSAWPTGRPARLRSGSGPRTSCSATAECPPVCSPSSTSAPSGSRCWRPGARGQRLHALLAADDAVQPGPITTLQARPGAALFFDAAGQRIDVDLTQLAAPEKERAYAT